MALLSRAKLASHRAFLRGVLTYAGRLTERQCSAVEAVAEQLDHEDQRRARHQALMGMAAGLLPGVQREPSYVQVANEARARTRSLVRAKCY